MSHELYYKQIKKIEIDIKPKSFFFLPILCTFTDRKKSCSLNDDDDAVSTLNCRCTKTTATLSHAAAIVNICKDI